MTRLGKERLLPRIRAISHENLRLMLSLWESLLCGDSAYRVWKQLKLIRSPGVRSTMDSSTLCSSAPTTSSTTTSIGSPISSRWEPAASVRRDLLIGHHALQLLAQDRHTQVNLHQALRNLGYSETNIGVVEKSLLTFNFFHEEPAGGKKIDYEIHEDVVQEYLSLRFEPAYVDNVAMITPVDPKYLNRMFKTRGDRPDDFVRRVGTTLAFLEFVRECEDQFRDPKLVMNTDERDFHPGPRVVEARLPLEADGIALPGSPDRPEGERLSPHDRPGVVGFDDWGSALRPGQGGD